MLDVSPICTASVRITAPSILWEMEKEDLDAVLKQFPEEAKRFRDVTESARAVQICWSNLAVNIRCASVCSVFGGTHLRI